VRRADVGYCQHERERKRKRREIQCDKKRKIYVEKDIRAMDAHVPLPEFRESVGYDSLRELPCAVCSGLCSNEYSTTVSVREINLLLLEANTDGKNEDPFVLRICNGCKRSLDAGNTPIFSLANMWIGTTPQCLQGLTIPELLISTGYMCINLIAITS
ncbi:8044_t:CDS:2, partial [Diversispora eburnea]